MDTEKASGTNDTKNKPRKLVKHNDVVVYIFSCPRARVCVCVCKRACTCSLVACAVFFTKKKYYAIVADFERSTSIIGSSIFGAIHE